MSQRLHVFHNHRRPHPPRRPPHKPPPPPSGPHFDFPVDPTPALVLPSVSVYLQTGLAAQGATGIVSFMSPILEAANAELSTWFKVPALTGFNCIVASLESGDDGSGGAYHGSCASQDLYCDAALNPTLNAPLTTALYFAEAVECYSAAQAKGWDCGAGNGEGLSRVLAEQLIADAGAPSTLDSYECASAWLDSTRDDFVSVNMPTDTDAQVNGCSVLFLWWLRSLGHAWAEIVQAGGATLADTYVALGGQGVAFEAFSAAVEGKWPVGTPSGVTMDNPW